MTRTLGRMLLLSAVAVVMLHGRCGAAPAPPAAGEESSMGRILEFQKKLNERITYELFVEITVDKALDELLTRQGIPWSVNTDAFQAAMQPDDLIKKTKIDKIDKMEGATRATVLKKLLGKIANDGGKGTPTYIIRRDSVEITTVGARVSETEGRREAPSDDAGLPVLPPLVYAAFIDVPLKDVLKELAHTTETAILLDARAAAADKTKVTAELPGVPLEAAMQLLTDMAGLKFVRVANVYYVTSPENADRLQQEEGRRQPTAAALLTPPRAAEQVAKRSPVDRKDGDSAAQTLVRPLLALTTVAPAPAPPPPTPAEQSSMGRILEFQKKLNERIDYELLVQTTLDKALNELLTQNGVPWTDNVAAFMAAQQDKNVIKKTEIAAIDKMTGVTRATVLKKLLAYIPNTDDSPGATYILRPDSVEITTRPAVRQAFYAGRHETHLPPLAYGAFKETPLREALAELARTAEYSVVLDPKAAEEGKSKVTAEFLGVPADTAVQTLADMAGLNLVRLESVYYVTTAANARLLRKEITRRRLEMEKILMGDQDPLDLPVIP
jgi:hypothetical protein